MKAGYLPERSKGKTKFSKLICRYHAAMLLFLSSPDLNHTSCVLTCQGCSGPSEVKSRGPRSLPWKQSLRGGVRIYQSALFLLWKLKKTQKLYTHKQWEEKCHLSPLQEMNSNALLHKDITVRCLQGAAQAQATNKSTPQEISKPAKVIFY